MTERWVGIPDWPRYEVSDQGRVRSLGFYVRVRIGLAYRRGRVLKIIEKKNSGRAQITLTNGERQRKEFQVSVLVAEAFLGPRPLGKYVAHKNDVKLDNRACNLYYATPTENQHDRWRNKNSRPGRWQKGGQTR